VLGTKPRQRSCYTLLDTPSHTSASDYQTPSGQIPGDEPGKEIYGYGGKYYEERRVWGREWKTPWEMLTIGPGSEPDDGEELGDDDDDDAPDL